MNSPTPSESSTSSASPPPEEFIEEKHVAKPQSLLNSLRDTVAPSKRRHPASQSARDPKSRRREREKEDYGAGGSRRQPAMGMANAGWTGEKERQKEDLADVNLADMLKKTVGDPFNETMLKD